MILSEKKAKALIISISLAVPAIVTALFYVAPPQINLGINLKFFPKFHAMLNSATTIALLLGAMFIQQKNVNAHRAAMLSAFGYRQFF
jgi:putative membrane protein